MSMIKNTLDPSKGGLTKQTMVDQTNINSIVAKARQSGFLPQDNRRIPQYADVSSVPDYQKAFDIVEKANQAFDALGSKVRARFANDPGHMIAFLRDNNNRDEAIALGLMELKQVPDKEPDTKSGSAAGKAVKKSKETVEPQDGAM